MNLVYLNVGDGSVIEAQVYTLLDYYKGTKKFNNLVLLQGYKSNNEKSILLNKLKNFNFPVIWFRAWPNFTWFDKLNILSLKLTLHKLPKNDSIIIHIRGDKFGALMKQAVNKIDIKCLVDIRGAILEEITTYNNSFKLIKQNKVKSALESFNIIRSNTYVSVVSQSLKEYLIESQNFDPKYISIHPNIAGEQFIFDQNKREKTRKKLGIGSQELVAICLSSDLPWQKDKEAINRLLQLNIRIINLSSKRIEFPGIINKKVPFTEVPNYLSAADIAILWREQSITNYVASPSKLSEFACNGLWIIHNGTVDIASEYIMKTGMGIIVQDINNIKHETISAIKKINRIEACIIGQKFFGIETVCSNYISLYQKILSI